MIVEENYKYYGSYNATFTVQDNFNVDIYIFFNAYLSQI